MAKARGALVDRGVERGLAGDDVIIISERSRTVIVEDIYNH